MLSNLTEMEALVKVPLSYAPKKVIYKADGVTPQEPPFIMSTFGEFAIPSGRTASTPFLADLRGPSASQSGFELDRTMAKITLESVSSNPMYSGQVTNNVATSYIFILKMGLVNVPQTYLWSPNREQSNPNPIQLPPYNGTYQTIDFALEDPVKKYYNRTWNGTITATATANVKWIQRGTNSNVKVYKIDKSAGIGGYSTTYNGYKVKDTISSINSGNFPTALMELYFTGGGGEEFDEGNLIYTNTVVTPTVTGAYWTLNDKNISYYVPENILADKTSPTNATKLYVKAAKASIVLDPNNVHFTQNQVIWGTNDNLPNWVYPPSTVAYDIVRSSFRFVLWEKYVAAGNKILDADIGVYGGSTKEYIHFWVGPTFYREASGTISITLQSPEFSKIVDSNNIKEFYLPIRNAPDTPNDYNVYRNHEYKFSVHALEQWAAPAGQAVNDGASVNNIQTRSNISSDETTVGEFVLRNNTK